jgi:hypothetical protein
VKSLLVRPQRDARTLSAGADGTRSASFNFSI